MTISKSNADFCERCGARKPLSLGTYPLCEDCDKLEQEAIQKGERWADEHEGNGYPSGTIGSETR